jgi:hypothetical protein
MRTRPGGFSGLTPPGARSIANLQMEMRAARTLPFAAKLGGARYQGERW